MEKESIYQLILAGLLCFVGTGLLFCGMFVPPQGEIHASVLVAFAEIATLAGALCGVNICFRNYLKKRDDEIK